MEVLNPYNPSNKLVTKNKAILACAKLRISSSEGKALWGLSFRSLTRKNFMSPIVLGKISQKG